MSHEKAIYFFIILHNHYVPHSIKYAFQLFVTMIQPISLLMAIIIQIRHLSCNWQYLCTCLYIYVPSYINLYFNHIFASCPSLEIVFHHRKEIRGSAHHILSKELPNKISVLQLYQSLILEHTIIYWRHIQFCCITK